MAIISRLSKTRWASGHFDDICSMWTKYFVFCCNSSLHDGHFTSNSFLVILHRVDKVDQRGVDFSGVAPNNLRRFVSRPLIRALDGVIDCAKFSGIKRAVMQLAPVLIVTANQHITVDGIDGRQFSAAQWAICNRWSFCNIHFVSLSLAIPPSNRFILATTSPSLTLQNSHAFRTIRRFPP